MNCVETKGSDRLKYYFAVRRERKGNQIEWNWVFCCDVVKFSCLSAPLVAIDIDIDIDIDIANNIAIANANAIAIAIATAMAELVLISSQFNSLLLT